MTLEMQTTCTHEVSGVPAPSGLFFRVKQLGAGAEEALRPGIDGRVLAVFRRSFYIQSCAGELLCLGPLSMGPGPLNVLYRFPLEINWLDIGLLEDALATFDGRALHIANRFVFDVFEALVWRPSAVDKGRCREDLAAGLAQLGKVASDSAPQDSLGYLIVGRPEKNEAENPEAAGLTVLQRACLNGAAELKKWISEGFGGRIDQSPPSGIQSLLGLGPGLTPSGDDLLGGAFIAMHSLGRADLAHALWDRLQPAAKQRTNTISLAHLNWAARGIGAEPIHLTIRALLQNDTDGLADCLESVGRIGHTSGWDMVAGIALVWRSYLENQSPRVVGVERMAGEKTCR